LDPNTLLGLRCCCCGAPIVVVGVFVPTTPEGRAAVLTLRQVPLHATRPSGLAYGLCREHVALSFDEIDDLILAAAGQVRVQ
jgi:hypothetical protein